MAERERASQDNDRPEGKRRSLRQGAGHSSNEPNFEEEGLPIPDETPFYPHMDGHASTLSGIPFSVQRHEFIMRLNNTYGYSYVQRLLESVNVQTKLTVSDPDDTYEKEADRVAGEVVRSLGNPVRKQTAEDEELLQGKPVQRQAPEDEELIQGMPVQRQEEEEELQASPDENTAAGAAGDIETRIDTARGGGQPLDDTVHKPMEQAFRADFSDVRVHTDSEADTLSRQLNARAFTTGQDIFFRQGEYSPGSDSGRKLLAHELTHVVQQNPSEEVQRAQGTYSPLDIGTAAGDYIAEIESGQSIGSGGIRFSGISSCIGLIGRQGNILKGVHLSLMDAKDNFVYSVNENTLLTAVQARLAGCTSFFKMGMLRDWEQDYPAFMGLISGWTEIYDRELANISSVMIDPNNPAGVILTDKDDKILWPGNRAGQRYTLHPRF